MSTLLIPVSPLEKAKSRLRTVFSRELLRDFTISLFKDFAVKVSKAKSFKNKLVFCNSSEILELAEQYNLTPVKENDLNSTNNFDKAMNLLNEIAIDEFGAKSTTIAFCDVILITPLNLNELNSLLEKNQLVICPAINSAGISIVGRAPPKILPTFFSDPEIPSLIAFLNEARNRNLKVAIYDSFRAGFDIDIKIDLVLAFEYLKAFNMKDTYTYEFLNENLELSLRKKSLTDNRELEIRNLKH